MLQRLSMSLPLVLFVLMTGCSKQPEVDDTALIQSILSPYVTGKGCKVETLPAGMTKATEDIDDARGGSRLVLRQDGKRITVIELDATTRIAAAAVEAQHAFGSQIGEAEWIAWRDANIAKPAASTTINGWRIETANDANGYHLRASRL